MDFALIYKDDLLLVSQLVNPSSELFHHAWTLIFIDGNRLIKSYTFVGHI